MKLIHTSYGPCAAWDPESLGVQVELYPEFDEYRRHFGNLRKNRKLLKLLKKERVWIRGWHLDPTRRKLPWLEDFKNAVAAFGKEPDRIHRKMYLDALHRAESAASEKTPIS